MPWNYDPRDPMTAFDDHCGRRPEPPPSYRMREGSDVREPARHWDTPSAGDAFEHELGVTMNPRIYEVGLDLLTTRVWHRGLTFALLRIHYEDGALDRSLFALERMNGRIVRVDLGFVHAIDR